MYIFVLNPINIGVLTQCHILDDYRNCEINLYVLSNYGSHRCKPLGINVRDRLVNRYS